MCDFGRVTLQTNGFLFVPTVDQGDFKDKKYVKAARTDEQTDRKGWTDELTEESTETSRSIAR